MYIYIYSCIYVHAKGAVARLSAYVCILVTSKIVLHSSTNDCRCIMLWRVKPRQRLWHCCCKCTVMLREWVMR